MKKIFNKLVKLYKKYEEIINYLIVGVLTTVVSLGTYFLVTNTFLEPSNEIELQIANIISWVLAVAFAYFTNRIFVFKSKNQNKIKEALSFVLARIFSLFIDMLTMYILVSLLHYNDGISKIATQVIIIIVNYVLSKLIVFRKSK